MELQILTCFDWQPKTAVCVLVSRDVATMPSHFAAFVATRSSPGVILIPPNATVGGAIEKLLIAWLTLAGAGD
jgi:hypothetical protein